MNNPLDKWKGQFGDEYAERNKIEPELIEARTNFWMSIFQSMNYVPNSMLEIGAGNGQNMMAIGAAITLLSNERSPIKCFLSATEPNQEARANLLINAPYVNIYPDSIYDIKQASGSIDFVFTSGVLIHIPPDQLDKAVSEMYRVSSKYILCAEYFSPQCEEIKYQEQEGLLWRSDFGGVFLDKYKLRVINYGFCWKRITKLDNLTWWLMEKTH